MPSTSSRTESWRVLNVLGSTALVVNLWVFSYPGLHPIGDLTIPFALFLFVPWLTLFIVFRRTHVRNLTKWWGPGLSLGLVAATALAAPVRARFALSRAAFQGLLEHVPDREGPWFGFDGQATDTTRVGLFQVGSIYRRGSGFIFYERWGAMFDDAGFAHLPDGPLSSFESGACERPAYRRMVGDWYAWTASW